MNIDIETGVMHTRMALRPGVITEVEQQADAFAGLPVGVSHLQLLGLCKDVGHHFGLNERDLMHLEFMVLRTQPQDWESDSRPIFYQSVAMIAEKRRCSRRTIQNIENRLHSAGFMSWSDRGDYGRSGYRDSTGHLVYAYGVDLSPLVSLYPTLVQFKRDDESRIAEKMRLRRLVGQQSRQIGIIYKQAEQHEALKEEATLLLDTYQSETSTRTDRLNDTEMHCRIAYQRSILEQFDALLSTINPVEKPLMTSNISDVSDKDCRPIYYTTNNPSLKRNTSNQPVDNNSMEHSPHNQCSIQASKASTSKNYKKINEELDCPALPHDRENPPEILETGIEHITIAMLYAAMNHLFRHHIPDTGGAEWQDVIKAAEKMVPLLGISSHAWHEACATLGLRAAAVSVLIIDARYEEIRSPGGFMRALIDKARNGELALHKSVFGLMELENTEKRN